MIAWSIDTAIKSNCFDKVLVSTDSEEIASLAIDFGACVPFLRPSSLSDDYSTTKEVIIHCINWLRSNHFSLDNVCCIYATAPFANPEDLKRAFKLIEKQKKDRFIFTATNFPFPIQRAVKINKSGISSMFYPDEFNIRSQDLEDAYHDAGQFYIAKPDIWINQENLFEDSMPVLLPSWRVQDIDEEDDWIRAEILHRILENENLN